MILGFSGMMKESNQRQETAYKFLTIKKSAKEEMKIFCLKMGGW